MDHGYDGGVFTAYVEGAKAGQMYKYLVEEQSGAVREHCDPYGFAMENARHLHRSLLICTSTGLRMRNGWRNGTNAMTNQ